jgi:hypothetical protein
MKPLESPDSHHLQAAVGCLELGNWSEANEELENITPQMRVHPDVLAVRRNPSAGPALFVRGDDLMRLIFDSQAI